MDSTQNKMRWTIFWWGVPYACERTDVPEPLYKCMRVEESDHLGFRDLRLFESSEQAINTMCCKAVAALSCSALMCLQENRTSKTYEAVQLALVARELSNYCEMDDLSKQLYTTLWRVLVPEPRNN